MSLKDELPRLLGAQYATGEEWRNNSIKNKETEPKCKQTNKQTNKQKPTKHPVADMPGDGSKAQCCKEQYCIGTQNIKSMNKGKLEVVKQDMARMNILGISELKWT